MTSRVTLASFRDVFFSRLGFFLVCVGSKKKKEGTRGYIWRYMSWSSHVLTQVPREVPPSRLGSHGTDMLPSCGESSIRIGRVRRRCPFRSLQKDRKHLYRTWITFFFFKKKKAPALFLLLGAIETYFISQLIMQRHGAGLGNNNFWS